MTTVAGSPLSHNMAITLRANVRQSLPFSRQSPSHKLLPPRVQPAVPDDHPDFTSLRLPPIRQQVHRAGPSQVQGGSEHHPGYYDNQQFDSISHRTLHPSQTGPQGGSGRSYGYGPAGPPQQQAPPHHPIFPNQQFEGSRQQVNPPSHSRTSSQAGPSQAQQQQAQAHSSPKKKRVKKGRCQMCNALYDKDKDSKDELRKHMVTEGHIRQLDPGPHTKKTRM